MQRATLERIKRNWVGTLKCDAIGYPYPTTFVGEGMIWDNLPRDLCPACNGGPLRHQHYCLYCDRWGLDSELLAEFLGIKQGPGMAPVAAPALGDASNEDLSVERSYEGVGDS